MGLVSHKRVAALKENPGVSIRFLDIFLEQLFARMRDSSFCVDKSIILRKCFDKDVGAGIVAFERPLKVCRWFKESNIIVDREKCPVDKGSKGKEGGKVFFCMRCCA